MGTKLALLVTAFTLLILGCSGLTNVQDVIIVDDEVDNIIPEPAIKEKKIEDESGIVMEDLEIIEEELTIIDEPIKEVVPLKIVDPHLIAHWKFDGDPTDSANEYDGIIMGGALYSPGKLGTALAFDGIDDYVSFAADAINDIGSLKQGSITFWLNFDSLLASQPVMPIFYLGIDDVNDNADNMYIIEIGHALGTETRNSRAGIGTPDPDNTKIYSTWIKDNKEPFLCSDSEVNLDQGKWQHFAIVSGLNGNTLYLDGEEVKNRDYNFGHSSDSAFLADIPVREILTLGYGRSSHMISPDFVYYKGLLDDFRVYDKELSLEEVYDLANP